MPIHALFLLVRFSLLLVGFVGGLSAGLTAAEPNGSTPKVLPPPAPAFRGTINLRAKDSTPDFPQPIQAPKGAPNVLLILLDDVGFGASSAFGGPCQTPVLEALAKRGLRYTQFHTTALCSPTRAALITGRNHHAVHSAAITEAATGFPGYDSVMQKDTATVAEVLKLNAWNTAWFGKNHNVPDWQTSQAGPFDLWPTGLGFEHFFGFIGGDTHQWRPAAIEGTKPVEPYLDNPDYHFDDDLADRAVKWIRTQQAVAPEKPFFLYYAPGATHAPHHPRKEWVEKYAGTFDAGWDAIREETLARQKKLGIVPADTKLVPLAPGIPAWASLTADQKKVYARMMEVYAGFLEQTDHNAGRVIRAIEEAGELDNTLVLFIVGDNGASAEGSAQGLLNEMTFFNGVKEDLAKVLARVDDIGSWQTYNHYPIGWAHAMCTPFQWTKQIASHYGGTRNGLVISWPKGIADQGALRTQWHHVIDIVPTIYEACGVTPPEVVNGIGQKSIDGVSIAYSFADADAPSRRTTQYFEMIGNRAIYHDGWVACTTPPVPPWDPGAAEVDAIDGYQWELYHTDIDFSQAEDLAASQPEKLRELQLLFYTEAARHEVLPIDNSKTARLDPAIRPSLTRGRTKFTYGDGMTRIPEGASPNLKNTSFRITADVDVEEKASGMIITQGGLFGGMGLFLRDGRPVYHANFVDIVHTEIAGREPLPPGRHVVALRFAYDGGGIGKGGTATLEVDGKPVAEGRIERTIPIRVTLDESLDVGEDTGTPVTTSYDVPFRFEGNVDRVVIDLE
jgi:arylsulfatase A-like enzyme